MSMQLANEPEPIGSYSVRSVVVIITKTVRPQVDLLFCKLPPKVKRFEWGTYCTKCLRKLSHYDQSGRWSQLCCPTNVLKGRSLQKCISINITAFNAADYWPPRTRDIKEEIIREAVRHYYNTDGTEKSA